DLAHTRDGVWLRRHAHPRRRPLLRAAIGQRSSSLDGLVAGDGLVALAKLRLTIDRLGDLVAAELQRLERLAQGLWVQGLRLQEGLELRDRLPHIGRDPLWHELTKFFERALGREEE